MGENQADSANHLVGSFFDQAHPIGSQVVTFFGATDEISRIQLLEWADLILYCQDRGITGKPLTNVKYHIKLALHNAELAGCILPFDLDDIMRLEQYGLPWQTEPPEIRQASGQEGQEDRKSQG